VPKLAGVALTAPLADRRHRRRSRPFSPDGVSRGFRVVRSGGAVGATEWASEVYIARLDALEAKFVPERSSVLLDQLTEEKAAGRFASHSSSVEVRQETLNNALRLDRAVLERVV
jgi:hypothetical protein